MAGGANMDDDEGGVITEINVTPLVDIMLVLLIIFMLTANIITQQSIEVELPNAVTGETTESTTVAFTIDAEANAFNGEAADEASLRQTTHPRSGSEDWPSSPLTKCLWEGYLAYRSDSTVRH